MNLTVTSYCQINSERIVVNGAELPVPISDGGKLDLKTLYKQLNIQYPKFYKMDALCQLGFLASELIIKGNSQLKNYADDEVAMILTNKSSSLDSDLKHQKSINDLDNFFPSPAVFVYTLPNIALGEIAIRNSFKGENSFFIFESFNADFFATYVPELFESGDTKALIGGWIEAFENNFEAFLFSVEKQTGVIDMPFNAAQLKKLYNFETV